MKALHLKRLFWGKYAFPKMVADTIIIIAVCAVMYWVMPHHAVFFELASVHTTTMQKLLHIALAIFTILGFRVLTCSYSQSWSRASALMLLRFIISDISAGILYYLLTEVFLATRYPFLLIFAQFAAICILSLFLRVLYRGFYEQFPELFNFTDA